MAEVYKEPKSKFWYCDYKVGKNPRVRKSTKRTNKKDAKKVADAWEKEVLERDQLGVSKELTLREALGYYVAQHQANPKSDAAHRVKKVCGDVEGNEGLDPNMMFHKLTHTEMVTYQQKRLAQGAAKQTINHEINAISAAYNIVSEDFRVKPKLKFPRFQISSTARPLLKHELDALLEHLDPNRKLKSRSGGEYLPHYSLGFDPVIMEQRQQNWDLVVCLVQTGCRLTELTDVTWDLVDKDWRFLMERTKNRDKGDVDKGRFMWVTPKEQMKAILKRRYESMGNNPYIFSAWKRTKRGGWLRDARPQTNTSAIRKAMAAVGINSEQNVRRFGRRDVRSLRDTYATILRQNGFDIADIQDLLGHATPAMTMKYAEANLDKVSERASGVWNEAL